MGPKEFYWDTVQGHKNMRENEWRWRPGAAVIYSVGANSTESQMFLLFIVILLNNMALIIIVEPTTTLLNIIVINDTVLVL